MSRVLVLGKHLICRQGVSKPFDGYLSSWFEGWIAKGTSIVYRETGVGADALIQCHRVMYFSLGRMCGRVATDYALLIHPAG